MNKIQEREKVRLKEEIWSVVLKSSWEADETGIVQAE